MTPGMPSKLVAPHGSPVLRPLLAAADERADMLARAHALKVIPLTSREVSDLFMLGMGAYTPLDGFMGHDDWKGARARHAPRPRHLLADPDHALARRATLLAASPSGKRLRSPTARAVRYSPR